MRETHIEIILKCDHPCQLILVKAIEGLLKGFGWCVSPAIKENRTYRLTGSYSK